MMSINTAHANDCVLIYIGELILLYADDAQLTIEGISSKEFSGSRNGRIYLTTHRMIFLNKNVKDDLQSFSFPFFSLSEMELKQPVFGANYMKGVVAAEDGANWTGSATFKLEFKSGGAIVFGQALLKVSNMANQYMESKPPPYTPYQGSNDPASPDTYMAPPGGVNGFVAPTQDFPQAPPENSVRTMGTNPPYAGIYAPSNENPPPAAQPQDASGQSGEHGTTQQPATTEVKANSDNNEKD